MDATPSRIDWRSQWSDIKLALRQDRIIYCYVLFTCVSLYLLSRFTDHDLDIKYDIFSYLRSLLNMCYVSFLTWSVYYYCYLLYHRASHPLVKYVKKIFSFFQPISKALSFILLILVLNFTLSSYTYLKTIIPDLHPFEYDLAFYEFDKWLHFGVSPWELTHAVFSHHYATFVINFFYHLWFLLMWGALLFFIIDRKSKRLRDQYLLSFLSSWLIVGGLLATILSSAGPCYMHLLNPEHTYFLPLIDTLRIQSRELMEVGFPPVWAIDVQDSLWLRHLNREGGVGVGISAMPSMHVSIAVLMALGASRKNKWLGRVMWANVVMIQIGSVHLAWHYAIDGYVSAFATVLIWKGTGILLDKIDSFSSRH
ncbi:phosphatase PAP2 family protein [Vibrio sp. 10N.261.55.A7]|uniref:phosphatase PAP2 family protein n=1 Tax=Vibrio sp. 10N.261.55.A7 TaxID=1880851 RepID=UPI000C85DD9E|nr:phosphatase PAP2 family protein [Vibrio sp. 10N.261.55.A7]PMJ92587.1 hypothetical protein BCU12_07595 [Vibrio sp. 10N.261.55.A7]